MSTEDAPGPGNVHDWLDQDAGPLVRSYALTGGRAGPGAETFDLLTYVVAMTGAVSQLDAVAQPEHHAILKRAHQPASVAEIASHLSRPLGVVRVLLNDLETMGAIARCAKSPAASRPDDRILQAVIDGLRAS
ncbi:hypothetical protein Rhe02_71310 [Rhizocola hellebori]|uniref:DUF742 domain-containing protein n=1 Tax=Rhizocola hellebori TaxID=1392758 RepID=A0A8J3QG86_9ACTN|nr:DUF742 domain-containing protein [Rhizocola hellebori]GIH09064.1 hypothetical protein Rhe02_71310 [Rhizocola hellebori]